MYTYTLTVKESHGICSLLGIRNWLLLLGIYLFFIAHILSLLTTGFCSPFFSCLYSLENSQLRLHVIEKEKGREEREFIFFL